MLPRRMARNGPPVRRRAGAPRKARSDRTSGSTRWYRPGARFAVGSPHRRCEWRLDAGPRLGRSAYAPPIVRLAYPAAPSGSVDAKKVVAVLHDLTGAGGAVDRPDHEQATARQHSWRPSRSEAA